MDGIILKIREDGKVVNKCVYIVIGLKADGIKEVLGFWIERTESASFWMTLLTALKALHGRRHTAHQNESNVSLDQRSKNCLKHAR